MTQALSTFAPNEVSVVISQNSTGITHVVSGYGADTMVMVERNSDTFDLYVGADDTTTRIYKSNTAGKVTLHLQQTSSSNDILTLLYNNDRTARDSSTLFSVHIKDNSGRSYYFADQAFIGVVPHSQFGNSMQLREWVLHLPNMESYIGGNSVVSPSDAQTIAALGGTVAPQWQQ